MGIVYTAFDPELDRRVAIKVMRPGAQDALGQPRLLREAKVLAKLNHVNVVSVYDVGTVDGSVFVAMEFVEGQTLKRWMSDCTSKVRERKATLALFLSAGEGLAAAHDAELVHRDFKPDNVMIAADGRVVVLDFGLAASRPHQRVVSTQEAVGSGLTATGDVMGTPAYMSPEQTVGEPLDAASDQFSFCVALYEALYGVRPFKGRNVGELSYNIAAAEFPETPRNDETPAWLRRVLIRGLTRDPKARYPSMRALMAALRNDPWRHRKRTASAVGAFAAFGTVVVAATMANHSDEHLCEEAASGMAEVWDDAHRESVRSAFSALAVEHAPDTLQRLIPAVDEYARGWAQQRKDACVANHIRGEQSDDFLGRRLICLDRRLFALDALATTLQEVDERSARYALTQVSKLPALELCADAAYLVAEVQPPDARVADEVTILTKELASILRRSRKEHSQEVRDEAAALTERARATGYGPIVADALLHQARVELATRGSTRRGDQFAFDALLAAERARADRVVFLALTELAKRDLFAERTESAERRLDRAQVALERLGNPTVLYLTLLRRRAQAAIDRRDLEAAVASLERVLTIRRSNGTYDTLWALSDILMLVDVHTHAKRLDTAEPLLEHALGLGRNFLGPKAPMMGNMHLLRGSLELSRGRPERALRSLQETERIFLDSGEGPAAMTVLAATHAAAAARSGDLETANDKLIQAIALTGNRTGANAAAVRSDFGEFLLARGRAHEAGPPLVRAVELLEREIGATHTTTRVVRTLLAEQKRAVGALDDAARLFAMTTRAYAGPNAAEPDEALARALTGQGLIAIVAGRPQDALPLLERAVAIVRPDDLAGVRARARFVLARLLVADSSEQPRARELAQQAEQALVELRSQPELLARVREWMQTHASK